MNKELSLLLAKFCEENGMELDCAFQLLTPARTPEQTRWLELFCSLWSQSDEMGLIK